MTSYDQSQAVYRTSAPIHVDANGVPIAPAGSGNAQVASGTFGVVKLIQSDGNAVLLVASAAIAREVVIQNTGLYDVWLVPANAQERGYKLSSGAELRITTQDSIFGYVPPFYDPSSTTIPYIPSAARVAVIS